MATEFRDRDVVGATFTFLLLSLSLPTPSSDTRRLFQQRSPQISHLQPSNVAIQLPHPPMQDPTTHPIFKKPDLPRSGENPLKSTTISPSRSVPLQIYPTMASQKGPLGPKCPCGQYHFHGVSSSDEDSDEEKLPCCSRGKQMEKRIPWIVVEAGVTFNFYYKPGSPGHDECKGKQKAKKHSKASTSNPEDSTKKRGRPPGSSSKKE